MRAHNECARTHTHTHTNATMRARARACVFACVCVQCVCVCGCELRVCVSACRWICPCACACGLRHKRSDMRAPARVRESVCACADIWFSSPREQTTACARGYHPVSTREYTPPPPDSPKVPLSSIAYPPSTPLSAPLCSLSGVRSTANYSTETNQVPLEYPPSTPRVSTLRGRI